jgi:hypothetical protein
LESEAILGIRLGPLLISVVFCFLPLSLLLFLSHSFHVLCLVSSS